MMLIITHFLHFVTGLILIAILMVDLMNIVQIQQMVVKVVIKIGHSTAKTVKHAYQQVTFQVPVTKVVRVI